MKSKNLIIAAFITMLSIVACQEKIDVPKDNNQSEIEETEFVPFSLYADFPSVGDGSIAKTNWNDGDIIYSTSEPDWKASFTCKGGKFTTDKKIKKGSRSFNFSTINAPEFTVPANQAASQTPESILAGQITTETPVEDVTVAMKHLVSFATVNISNKSKKEIALSSLEIEAPEAVITGTFSIKFGENTTAGIKSNGASKISVNMTGTTLANDGQCAVKLLLASANEYKGKIKVTVTAADGVNASADKDVDGIIAGETYSLGLSFKPAEGPNLVQCGDFETDPASHWTIKNVNGDKVNVMSFDNGCLKIERPTASDKDYRFVCYNKLSAPLEAGKWYKMSVKMSVPTACTWYARGIDLGFCVFGIDPATLNDYKANKDKIFFVDTDMENARKEVGPLHGTESFVNFPTVCTYCNPAALKTNGGIFKAVEGQQWVGFYLRQRSSLKDLNAIYFDDVTIQQVDAPEE